MVTKAQPHALLTLALVLAACGGVVSGLPPGQDAGTPAGDDAGTALAGDAGAGVDAGATVDAGVAVDAGQPDAGLVVLCLGSAAGAWCGNNQVQGGAASTLYQCPGAGRAPTSSTVCAAGCVVEPAGTNDHCAVPVSPDSYRLPWRPGVTMLLTQDCDDACCNDHVGTARYAWDFATSGAFTVVAARGGTVQHLKMNSTTGCGASSCVNLANVIVIDHGDGTQATYLHLKGMTLAAGVSCGAAVVQGQELATAGTTGWSTGVHLHFQVSGVHTGAPACECGSAGTTCSEGFVPWSNFWSSGAFPTSTIQFVEWPAASQCANRRLTLPASQNP